MRNIRFWHFMNDGWVKITLRPETTLHHYKSAPTDEGWSSEAVMWSYDGDVASMECIYDGRDCDGRLTRGYDLTLEKIETYPKGDCLEDFPGGPRAVWRETDSYQRDQYAELMNY